MTAYAFTPMSSSDLPMVRIWLETPEVRRWWGEPAEQYALVSDDKTIDIPAVSQVLAQILALGKTGIEIQRFKGLGEAVTTSCYHPIPLRLCPRHEADRRLGPTRRQPADLPREHAIQRRGDQADRAG